MKKRTRKAVSLALSSILLTSAFSGISCPSAQSEGVDLPPAIITSTTAQGDLNLTQLGGMDWVHMRGDHMERKADTAPVLQMAIGDGTDSPLSVIDHSPVTYFWNDSVNEDMRSAAATIFGWKKGQENSVGMDIEDEVGYTITISAADVPQVLTVVSGLWHGEAEFFLYADDESAPVYTHSDRNAENAPAYTKHCINIRQGHRLKLVYRLSKKNAADGCVMLGAAALNKLNRCG